MSLAEFVEWEARQEGRWEFDGFQPILMTGASALHNLIVGNLEFAIRRRLTPPCRIFRETLRLELSHTSRYPDLMVACGPRPDGNHLTDPILLVEVLSRSSFRTDRIHKNREYEATASVRRYEGVLVMPEIGVEVPLTEVYAELEVPLAEEKSDEPETA
jgi:Uma2 family endonuclease